MRRRRNARSICNSARTECVQNLLRMRHACAARWLRAGAHIRPASGQLITSHNGFSHTSSRYFRLSLSSHQCREQMRQGRNGQQTAVARAQRRHRNKPVGCCAHRDSASRRENSHVPICARLEQVPGRWAVRRIAVTGMPAFAQQPARRRGGCRRSRCRRSSSPGSRIASPNAVSTSPIQVISSQSMQISGKTDITDIINQLPQNFTNDLGQDLGNGTSGLTTAGGVATADLRGLGPARTLVLIDGRRLGRGFAEHRHRGTGPRPRSNSGGIGGAGRSRHRRRLRGLWLGRHRRRGQLHHEARTSKVFRSTARWA